MQPDLQFLLTAIAVLSARATPSVSIAGNLETGRVSVPTGSSSRVPWLSNGPSGGGGGACLSWVVEGESEATLCFSRRTSAGWEPAREVLRGSRWFVNWADVPSLVGLGEATWLAHFLQRSGEATYDYHAYLVRSVDGGRSWGEPRRLHDDEGAGEHGFVSLVPTQPGEAVAVWLDGRGTQGHAEAGNEGATALYLRTIGRTGALGPERLLDDRVCDCCPTSALELEDGSLLVAYRDRSLDETRDIAVIRASSGGVIRSRWASEDGWKIAGCPVNGPVLARSGKRVGLAWYTLDRGSNAHVLCAFSDDGGARWSQPLELAGRRSQGRVAAVYDRAARFVVTWLESGDEGAAWRVARVEDSRVIDTNTIVASDAARQSGIARIVADGDEALFSWTEAGEEPSVGMMRLRWR